MTLSLAARYPGHRHRADAKQRRTGRFGHQRKLGTQCINTGKQRTGKRAQERSSGRVLVEPVSVVLVNRPESAISRVECQPGRAPRCRKRAQQRKAARIMENPPRIAGCRPERVVGVSPGIHADIPTKHAGKCQFDKRVTCPAYRVSPICVLNIATVCRKGEDRINQLIHITHVQ